jgi:hypothetical protein
MDTASISFAPRDRSHTESLNPELKVLNRRFVT